MTQKNEIFNIVSHYTLNIKKLEDGKYGASNIHGEWNGLQALFPAFTV